MTPTAVGAGAISLGPFGAVLPVILEEETSL